jgi:hypothetical protein
MAATSRAGIDLAVGCARVRASSTFDQRSEHMAENVLIQFEPSKTYEALNILKKCDAESASA